MPSAPDIEIPLTDDHARESSSSFSEGEDFYRTIETRDGNDFLAIEQPRPFGRKESLQKEKQISVDPVSLRGSPVRQASFTLISPLPTATKHPLPAPPAKLKFVSTSLPSSASSSPRPGSTSLLKKIWKNPNEASPRPSSNVSRQHLSMDDADLALQETSMRRSKSVGEGRAIAPADDFDLIPNRPTTKGPHHEDFRPKRAKQRDVPEDGFKCGKLCLFLPRGKGKPVRASSSSSISSLPSRVSSTPSLKTDPQPISRTVSLERFDCGSLSSSFVTGDSEREPTNLFFDLPLELIRCSVSDMQSPVTAAFVFDKEANVGKEPKGVLKNASGSTQGRKSKSQDSTRHVRFSTSSATSHPSSPTCITPRLRKARADFNAFLEAQST